jgi:hypothetical protein
MTTKLISELIKSCQNSLCWNYVSIRAVLFVCSEMLITRTSRLLQCPSYSDLLSRPAQLQVTRFIRPVDRPQITQRSKPIYLKQRHLNSNMTSNRNIQCVPFIISLTTAHVTIYQGGRNLPMAYRRRSLQSVIQNTLYELSANIMSNKTRNVRYIPASLCNHCCCGKAISIAYSECVLVALGIQHAMRMRPIVICGLSGSTLFFHIS